MSIKYAVPALIIRQANLPGAAHENLPGHPPDLRRSVIAVPPLARRADLSLNEAANRALLAHLEAGGVRSVMYGGNANFYNVGWASTRASWICWPRWQAPTLDPAVGGAGLRQDDGPAAVLRTRAFPTAMLLPMSFPYTDDGLADGVRRFTDALAKPAVVYIKSAGYRRRRRSRG